MLIVDSQSHITAKGRGNWPKSLADRLQQHCMLETSDLVEEMVSAGVDAVVLVPGSGVGGVRDDRPALDAAIEYPERFGVMGTEYPRDEQDAGRLDSWLETPGMLGFRVSFSLERGLPRTRLHDGSLEWLWTKAEEFDLPAMIFAPEMANELFDIAQRHPGLRLIVDHLTLPSDHQVDDLRSAVLPLLRLASLENVAVKASALPTSTNEAFPFPSVRECIKEVVGVFGADRVFWGSDLSRLTCTYQQLVTFFLELDFLSEEERRDIMGGAILRWLRWKIPQAKQVTS